jgi:hypothetical protein
MIFESSMLFALLSCSQKRYHPLSTFFIFSGLKELIPAMCQLKKEPSVLGGEQKAL